MSIRSVSQAILLPGLIACGGAKAGTETAPQAMVAQPSSAGRLNRDLITQQELSPPDVRTLTVLDAIRRLRPQFLNSGVTNPRDTEVGRVHASIDYGSITSVDELEHMRVRDVLEIRFLNAGAALQRFGGSAFEGPVIVVITR